MIHHQFKTKCHNLPELFTDVHKLSQFISNLQRQSKLDPDRYDPYKYVGDGFEFFIELLLYFHPCDNRIGVSKYIPNQINDNGVDGVGININGDKCVIQVKFRSNIKKRLTANSDHLSNLITDGMLNHGVVADSVNIKNYRHFVFTTSKGLHFYTDHEMFKGRVKCIGYNEIRQLVDNNIPFWNAVRELISKI